MIVGVLGPLELDGDGRRVGGGRLRALLARLALDAGRPVTTGRLVDAVWEDELPADQLHALQSLVSRLRRALGDGRLGRRARRLRAARRRRRGALRARSPTTARGRWPPATPDRAAKLLAEALKRCGAVRRSPT